jgi:hypothetical protein
MRKSYRVGEFDQSTLYMHGGNYHNETFLYTKYVKKELQLLKILKILIFSFLA